MVGRKRSTSSFGCFRDGGARLCWWRAGEGVAGVSERMGYSISMDDTRVDASLSELQSESKGFGVRGSSWPLVTMDGGVGGFGFDGMHPILDRIDCFRN